MKHRNQEVEISPCSYFCFFKVFVPKIMQLSIAKTSVFPPEILMHDCVLLTLSLTLCLSCCLVTSDGQSLYQVLRFLMDERSPNRLRFRFDEHPVLCHLCCSAHKFTGIPRRSSFWTLRWVNFKASARKVRLFFSWLPIFHFSRKKVKSFMLDPCKRWTDIVV